jgi:hypothetical protein
MGEHTGRRFRDIPYTGRKSRNVEEGNGRACRKEMEEPCRKEIWGHTGRKSRDIQEEKANNMQEGTGGTGWKDIQAGKEEKVGKTVKGRAMHCL